MRCRPRASSVGLSVAGFSGCALFTYRSVPRVVDSAPGRAEGLPLSYSSDLETSFMSSSTGFGRSTTTAIFTATLNDTQLANARSLQPLLFIAGDKGTVFGGDL